MRIEWVNHASFIVDHDGVRLICDPWLQGRVFNNSWAHIVPTRFAYEAFDGISHIWLSHEHPDHFNPPDLVSIRPTTRARICVLYQETLDQKVLKYCARLGFGRQVELKMMTWYKLARDLAVMCGKMVNGTDSWLCVRSNRATLLNMNDCYYVNGRDLERVKRLVGHVDVLLAQFSYAGWAGNRVAVEQRRAEARWHIDRLRAQLAVLRPTYVVPFASYVWFCNEDNFFMNDSVNRIEDVFHMLSETSEAAPVILFPDDCWIVGSGHNSVKAVERYRAARERLLATPLLFRNPRIDFEALAEAAENFRHRSLGFNSRRKLLGYRPVRIYLADHGRAVAFSFKEGLRPITIGADESDIALGSQPLKYCFDHAWGFDTLLISGVFEKPPRGVFRNFEEYQWVAHLNNHGKRLDGPIGRRLRALRECVLPEPENKRAQG